jgi:AAA ATPase domain
VTVVGRDREVDAVHLLLDRAAAGSGGVLVLSGPAQSGRTVLADASAATAGSRGFDVLRLAAAKRQTGQWLLVQLLRDVDAPGDLIERLQREPGPRDLDLAVELLCSGPARLIVLDDVERGGSEALDLVGALAGRAVSGCTAVVATAVGPLGVGTELSMAPLGPEQIGLVVGEDRPDVQLALWAASGGRPGSAVDLARTIAELPPDADPVVELALRTRSGEQFLAVDTGHIHLLELALERTEADSARARLLARLAHALLGDAFTGERRRALVEEALVLARRSRDQSVLAEVLDSALHALWDADGAADRLVTSEEIATLARSTADLERGRGALFWRFVALMELARVAEAESALAAFERQAELAADAAGQVMAVSRHAMLATLRGRFDEARRLTEEVQRRGQVIQLPDTEALVGTLRGAVTSLQGDWKDGPAQVDALRAAGRTRPGHFYDATAARLLVSMGHSAEGALELERTLPLVLAGTGPRWLGAVADLAVVAVATENRPAAEQLYAALSPYRGQLVIWAGANTCTGPVAHYLGLLAGGLGRGAEAAELFHEAIAVEERVGALPWLALTSAALADVLSGGSADDEGVAREVSEHRGGALAIAQRLGLSGVLASLSPPTDEWTLRREGENWVLTAGAETARLRDTRGMGYLRSLLASPGREIASLDLVAGGVGLAGGRSEPTLDAAGRKAYRRRLAALDDELARADAAGDAHRAERVEDERRTLIAELRRGTGLGGRPRAVAAEDERARVNVTRALRAAVERIAMAAPRAGGHLESSIRTGRACRYEPSVGGPTRWHV